MKIKNGLIWLCILFAGFTANVWAATDTIVYTYDNNQQIIRANYNNNIVVDYVYDGMGNRLVCSTSTSGVPSNNAPVIPANPLPANGSTNIIATTMLSWTGGDPDTDDQIVYDIYLGTSGNPPLYREAIKITSFQPERLLPATTYYWKIKARDNHNAAAESPVWSFTTGNEAPFMPMALSPIPGGATIAYNNVYLSWQGGDPDVGDSQTYDIYFGVSSGPPLVKSDHTNSIYGLGTLAVGTTYYWKIVAKDGHGGVTAGPVWSFTTAVHAPVILNSAITTDTTLTAADGPYIVGSGFSVQAIATLTIQPGTILKMQANAYLYVYGKLIAEGQNDNPIIITSENDDTYGGDTNGDGVQSNPAKGDWGYIYFANSADVSRLSYVKVFYAGGSGNYGALCCGAGSTSIANCTISNSASYGVYINNGSQAITNNMFINNAKYDIYIAGTCSGAITGNSIRSGIYAGSGILGSLSSNIIAYNNSYPVRLSAEDIGKLLANNTITNVTANSYLEVTGGTISHDAAWNALMPYRILGSITIQGTDGADTITTLTIQPGAKLLFNQYTQLIIGAYSGATGALSAQGTAVNPILFTSGKSPQAAGDWSGIYFYPTTNSATTILNYCTIEYAGTGTGGYGVYIYAASPTLFHCTIRYSQGDGNYVQSGAPVINYCSISNCGRYGINVVGGTPTITNNTFSSNGNFDLYINSGTNVVITGNTLQRGLYVASGVLGNISANTITYNDSYPIRVNADDVSKLLANNTINNVTANSYLEVTGGTISHDAAWNALMPYRILGSITVQGTDGADTITTLTIQPGAKLLFNQYTQLIIGAYSGATGALSAQGTVVNPILFTSGKSPQAAGDWYGIYFYPTTNSATTILNYCTIQYAGYAGSGALNIQASPTISHCIIQYSQGNGINVQSGAPQISYCNIGNCSQYGIYVASGTPTITNNTFSSNGNFDLYINSGTNVVITGNTLQRGLYVASGVLGNISANTITYNDSYPIRVNADDVSKLLANNTINNVTANSYLEVTGGTISHDATWTNRMPYHLLGSITVQGTDGADAVTTLTIQPGAKLLFSQGIGLYIGGSNGAPGALNAQGTAINPVLFTSRKVPQASGDWVGITFYSTTAALSALTYCTIEYAGYATGSAVNIFGASPTLSYCTIRNNQGYGIYITGGAPNITNNTFASNGNFDLYIGTGTNVVVVGNTLQRGIYVANGALGNISGNMITYNDSYPIRLNADDVGKFLSSNTIANVTANSYLEVTAGTISHDANWTTLMPYHMIGSVTVQGTDGSDAVTTLTIQPGAKLLFNQGTSLTIGGSSGAPGALNAQGTAANPILFTSGKSPQTAGDWFGIFFQDTTNDAATILDYCTVQYAGYGSQGALYISQCSPTIKNTIVSNSSSYGAYIFGGSPNIQNCTISNCSQYGIYVYSGTPTIANNTFSSNGNFDIYINNGTNVIVTNNALQKGIYVASGVLGNISANTITYNDSYPIRVNADDVSKLLANNTINNVTANSYLEVTGGTISHDAAWNALMPYRILGSITVQGTDGADTITTLTIQPGAKLLFNQYTGLTIGGTGTSAPGALNAQGTSANRILFSSGKTPQAAGDWYGIAFQDTTNDSTTILDYCTIQYAGYGSYGALYIYQCSPTIKNTIVSNSSNYGVYVYNGSPIIQNCQFTSNANYDLYYNGTVGGTVSGCTINNGIYFSGNGSVNFSGNTINYNNNRPIRLSADNVGNFMAGSTIGNTTPESYLEVMAGTISHDATWTNRMPYRILGSITVQGTDGADAITTLTIQPGAKLLFNQYTGLTIGGTGASAPGALNAQGTSANRILFTSGKTPQAAGDWYGIIFYPTTSSTTILDYCTVQYAGYGSQGALYIYQCSPTIKNTIVSNSSNYGVYVNGGLPVIQNCQFTANANYDLYYSGTVGGSVSGCTINNGIYLLATGAVSLSGNTVNYNNTYPIKVYTDNVGAMLSGTTITNVTANSYLEVTGGTISHDATWTNVMPYRILGSITVQGTDGADAITTLTIQPGAKLLFNQYTGLTIGGTGTSAPGALNAQGTSANRILFTSGKTPQAAGDWYGIIFYPTTSSATVLDYCTVQYAGYGSQGALYIYQCSPTIKNTIVNNSSSYGVYVYNGSPIIQNCQFTANANYDLYYSGTVGGMVSGCTINNGIYFSGANTVNFSGNIINYNNNRPIRVNADDVSRLLAGGTIGNTTPDSYLDVMGGIITKDAVWTNAITYHILNSITVQGIDGADAVTTLIIQPGAKLLFNQYTQLTVGAGSGAPGALNAQGTGANPILFTSVKATQAAGDWYGIYFYNTTNDATTILDYCLVQYAGYGSYGAIYIDQAAPTIKNTAANNSSSCGVYIYNSSPTIQNSLFNTNGNYDLYYSGTVAGSVQGCTINKGIYLLATSTVNFSGTTVNYNNAFPIKLYADSVGAVLSGTTLYNINSNSYLAVSGGTISHDAAWTSVIPYYIQGNILVQGKDGTDNVTTLTIQPGVLLLFYQYTSLTIGNSSGDPGALIAQGTTANPIWFTSSKTTPAAGDWYGVYFYNTADDSTTIMEYCNVEYGGYSNQGGIYIQDANPTLRYNNIFNNKYGIYVYSGNPVITNNNIFNNIGYGLYRATASILTAQYNWWGNATGPYHPTANPAGTGNAVSNYVNFTPWLTE